MLGGISSASPLVRVVIALASGSTEVREFELRRTAKLAALQRTATERLFPFVVPFIFVRDFIFRKFVTMALRLKSLRSALSSILTHTYRHTRRKLHTHVQEVPVHADRSVCSSSYQHVQVTHHGTSIVIRMFSQNNASFKS